MPLTLAEVRWFLLENGVEADKIDATWSKGRAALEDLAGTAGCSLRDEGAVRAAHVAALAKKEEEKRAATEASLTPLTEEERARFRLAFDHFDADGSGALDHAEFRKAMIDSGMMPLRSEVTGLFQEADVDGSGTVNFDEYCHFIQVYRAKQSWWERLMESAMDCLSPKPSYLTNPTLRFVRKMKHAGCTRSAIDAFVHNYEQLRSAASMMIPEDAIFPVDQLPALEDISVQPDRSLLQHTVMLKLNGGLGTGMGLEKAKSLLPISGDDTFLDLIAKQVLHMRHASGGSLAFLLMNSFSTSADSMALLKHNFPNLSNEGELPLEFLQNKAPKVSAADLSPASWPANPELEWCPPGHGDLYPAMEGSGTLDRLLREGYKYMFVSNSDNLGATMDLTLLTWFAQSGAPFAMEVAARTDSDKKGGHLARSAETGGLLLRESAQCPEEDEARFADVNRHRFFNTNNLWLDLEALQKKMRLGKGVMPLPVMSNKKTVDPRDKASAAVLQLETAMGAAIQCFGAEAKAILTPRSRFAPVKTTGDLLALKSDAYEVTPEHCVTLAPERKGVPPIIKLDGSYKFCDQLATLIPDGAPSLLRCTKLTVEGPFVIESGVVFQGEVKLINPSDQPRTVPAGVYKDATL